MVRFGLRAGTLWNHFRYAAREYEVRTFPMPSVLDTKESNSHTSSRRVRGRCAACAELLHARAGQRYSKTNAGIQILRYIYFSAKIQLPRYICALCNEMFLRYCHKYFEEGFRNTDKDAYKN